MRRPDPEYQDRRHRRAPVRSEDIDTIEIQRGGYSAEFGDRAYGVFNVVPRSGFERDREAELLLNYGNFHETNDQVSLGDHSDRAAYTSA